MKEIRTKVCKKANAYIKSGMNRSAAFKRAWSETYVKAANLQNGDKIKEIRELKRMQEELAAELDALVDEVKRYMDAEGVDTISGTDWKVTYKAVTSARFDSTAFKKAMPDLAEAFTKTTTSKRFCIA